MEQSNGLHNALWRGAGINVAGEGNPAQKGLPSADEASRTYPEVTEVSFGERTLSVLPQLARTKIDFQAFAGTIKKGTLVLAIEIDEEPANYYYLVTAEPNGKFKPVIVAAVREDFEPVGTWVLDTPHSQYTEPDPDPKKVWIQVNGR